MALQVAVRAVVADDLEGVGRGLERPAGALAAVAARARPLGEGPRPRAGVERGHAAAQVGQHAAPRGPERVGQHPRLPVGVEVDQSHARLRRRGGPVEAEPRDEVRGGPVPRGEVLPGRHATIRPVHAGEEGGDHRAQLPEHRRGALAGLGQRVGAHPDEHGLVGLPRGVDPDVGRGGRRQQPPQQVERLRPDGALAGRRRGAGLLRDPRADVLHQARQQARIAREGRVERRDVVRAERGVGHHVARPVVAVAAARHVGEGDVARRTARGSSRGAPTGGSS